MATRAPEPREGLSPGEDDEALAARAPEPRGRKPWRREPPSREGEALATRAPEPREGLRPGEGDEALAARAAW